jgi:predicted SnoaL-like aldol condensation-catalyzing enzyme
MNQLLTLILKYIQHNLGVADGLAGFGALYNNYLPIHHKVNTVRAFEDGDFFTMSSTIPLDQKIGFDILDLKGS